MNVFTYRATSKHGKTYEGDIIANSEEEAFLELSTKPFLSNNIMAIELRLKTSEEINVDNQLRRLMEYKKRLANKAMGKEDEEQIANTSVLTYRESRPKKRSTKNKILRFCILVLIILAMSALVWLAMNYTMERFIEMGRNQATNG
jgi:hypothetical protein